MVSSSGSNTPVDRKRPCTRSVTMFVEEDSAAVVQQETGKRWSSVPDLTDSQSDGDKSEEVSFYDIWCEDNMPYPYSKFREGVDAEAHIRNFLTTWEINHGA